MPVNMCLRLALTGACASGNDRRRNEHLPQRYRPATSCASVAQIAQTVDRQRDVGGILRDSLYRDSAGVGGDAMNTIESVHETLQIIERNWNQLQMFANVQIALNTILLPSIMPDWSDAPEEAQYCITDANQFQHWTDEMPDLQYGLTGWIDTGAMYEFYREVVLPMGIDWRLCIWQRPEAQP